jgi:hypothetical protein
VPLPFMREPHQGRVGDAFRTSPRHSGCSDRESGGPHIIFSLPAQPGKPLGAQKTGKPGQAARFSVNPFRLSADLPSAGGVSPGVFPGCHR